MQAVCHIIIKGVVVLYLFTLCFISLDFATGLLKSIAKKDFESSKMREGLFHKVGSIIAIVLGVLVEQAATYIDIGVNVEVATAICGYIIIMEIGSIIENIGAINPELVPAKIRDIFLKIDKGDKKC